MFDQIPISGLRRALNPRDAPPGVLLTLYGLREVVPPSNGETTEVVPPDPTKTVSPGVIPSKPVVTVSNVATATDAIISPDTTVVDVVIKPGKTQYKTTVTTVTYTIVNPTNPSSFTVTEYRTTLSYEPCSRCVHQPISTVDMTTYRVPCSACGHGGENLVTITAPCAAVTEPVSNAAPQKHPDLVLPKASHMPKGPLRNLINSYHASSKMVQTVTTDMGQTEPTPYGGDDNPSDEHGSDYNPFDTNSPDNLEDHYEPDDEQDTGGSQGGDKQDTYTSQEYEEPQKHPGAFNTGYPGVQPTRIQQVPSPLAPGTASGPTYGPIVPVVIAAGVSHDLNIIFPLLVVSVSFCILL
ncbi:uncharacterized protein FTOL_11989 [Fusarium torulosum]|uniref:Uncharacterized protein n=1 Tax=Fusarium torulosum TaxID=33205 RepID=A0AAE8MKX5_9HYPO|nr:uncharacterized protein FTOL_11989 [Fusarium torulosum]